MRDHGWVDGKCLLGGCIGRLLLDLLRLSGSRLANEKNNQTVCSKVLT